MKRSYCPYVKCNQTELKNCKHRTKENVCLLLKELYYNERCKWYAERKEK